MTIDSQGRLFITFLSWIEAYNLEGQFLFRFGQGGDQPGEFQAPKGISTDAKDRMYVVDAGNRRIQVFQVANQAATRTAAAR
jgi:tripartite motif-containing protein 2/3